MMKNDNSDHPTKEPTLPIADRVYRGGPIITMDPEVPRTTAVAVADGRIIAVGAPDCDDVTTPATEVVDLNGRTLIPGFHDAHAHPVLGGMGLMHCNLDDIHGFDAYLERIRTFADSRPQADWIIGSGWYGDVFEGGFPHRRDLDTVVGDRPAVFTSHDAHGVWADTAALELAGITRDTPDPDGGRIVRDADGEPTGMLVESAAELVAALVPPTMADDVEQALLDAQRYFHSLGVVGWQDAGVGVLTGSPHDTFPPYVSLARRGEFSSKVTGALWWDRTVPFADQISNISDRRDQVEAIDSDRAVGGCR